MQNPIRYSVVGIVLIVAVLATSCGNDPPGATDAARLEPSNAAAQAEPTPSLAAGDGQPTSPAPRDEGGVEDQPTPGTTSDDTPGPDAQQPVFQDPQAVGLSMQDLDDAAQKTLDLPALRFRLVAESSIPGFFSGSVIREAWYDLRSDSGRGLLLFGESSIDPDARDLEIAGADLNLGDLFAEVEGLRFEYLFLADTLWQLIPQPGTDGQWIGFDATDLEALNGVAARFAVDGGLYLEQILSALMEAPEVSLGEDGSTLWSATFDADVVAPLAAGSGTVQRLFDAGFSGDTGLSVPGSVAVSPSGEISLVDIDVSEWWAEGMRSGGAAELANLAVTLRVS